MSFEKRLEVVKLVTDTTRFRILKLLQLRPVYVCELSYILGLTFATISSHLSKLKEFGIVACKKEGNKSLYFLKLDSDNELRKLIEFLLTLGDRWEVVKKDKEVLEKISLEKVCSKKEK